MTPEYPDVFLNIPYDAAFEVLTLAMIAAASAHGLNPRAACEIGGAERLDKIIELIQECPVSLHDFSRFSGRLNVPIEFGIAYGWRKLSGKQHTCFVFTSNKKSFDRAASDLRLLDPHVHRGQPRRLLVELANVFAGGQSRPTLAEMSRIYGAMRKSLPRLKRHTGCLSLFEPRLFKDAVILARQLSAEYVARKA